MASKAAKHEERARLLRDRAEKVRAAGLAMHRGFQHTMDLTAASYERMAKQLETPTEPPSLPEKPSPRLSPEPETTAIADPK
jgi:hypothetical protein